MSVVLTVSYPRTEDLTFDLDYYVKHHILLVEKVWAKYGMKEWYVSKLDEGAPYSVSATYCWDSKEQVEEALVGMKELLADVSKYTN